jgi:hypothetical protein
MMHWSLGVLTAIVSMLSPIDARTAFAIDTAPDSCWSGVRWDDNGIKSGDADELGFQTIIRRSDELKKRSLSVPLVRRSTSDPSLPD